MKKITLLAAVCTVAASLSALTLGAGFSKTQTYTNGEFKDVSENAWYASEVKNTYELGLMNGEDDGIFNPSGNVTVAQAITMASRANAIYSDSEIQSVDGGKWYSSYVNYGMAKGFVKEGQFDSYDRPAKRYEVAKLFYDAMPNGYFTKQNEVKDIPDVSDKKDYKDELLALYGAGVVMGSDEYGNFFPENNITRAEAAAIINRVALAENRLKQAPSVYSEDMAYMLVYNDSFDAWGGKEGINSGWALDNRGGAPRTNINDTYGSLADVSTEYGTAMIREFNNTTTGRLQLDATFSVSENSEGVYMEFRNKDGKSVYRLEVKDKAWTVLNADGTTTKIYEISNGETVFTFKLFVDLDNNVSNCIINGKDTGEFKLATSGSETNLQNYRYGTTEKSTAVVRGTAMSIVVNFAHYDDASYTLKSGESKYVAFRPVSGIAVAENSFIPDNSVPFEYRYASGNRLVATLKYDGKDLYVNDVLVYEDLVTTVWYRYRLEMDTDNQNIIVKINGREVNRVDFANPASSVDNYTAENKGKENNFSVGASKVFEKKIAQDYVPQPVKPKGEEKYNVGINICSLWRNGMHSGWACITPFDDIKPVLGYYDEGNTETADWEIKYMVEHGIDYQAFCWFPGRNSVPISVFSNHYHLHDGYMNAEYSDQMKYCLIWEASSGAKAQNLQQWKDFFVPCLIEHYFKDPRYMTVDNQLLFYMFTPDKVYGKDGFGSTEVCKQAFDYLEEEVRKLGFDGVLFLGSNGASSTKLKEAGFDGTCAYNWGSSGYKLETNINSNLANAKDDSVFTIPTISVGFNNIGWSGTVRYPLMTAEDMKSAAIWARDEFAPQYAQKDTWQENMYMISTWNEYGEGTYIMPCEGLNGFGYLDALREVFTDEKADASLNTVPTENQLKRINRMYPQHKRLLRKNGDYTEPVEEIDVSKYKSVLTVIPATHPGSINASGINDFKKNDDGSISGITASPDNYLAFGNGNSLDLSKATLVKITAKIPKGKAMRMYFTTVDDSAWNEAKAAAVAASETDDFAEYYVDFSKNKNWKGTLRWYRIDPTANSGDEFVIKSIEFLGTEAKAPEQQKKMAINGNEIEMKLPPEKAPNGDYVVAFDLTLGLEFLFNTLCTWDEENQVLTIEGCEHTVVYTVGKDSYIVDGKEKKLGYTMYTFDSLPMIPLEKFCKDMGFKFEMTQNGPSVETTEKKEKADFYKAMEERVPYSYDFNVNGDNEGWTTSHMTLLTSDGYMSCQSKSSYADPAINLKFTPFKAEEYTVLKIRVRYDYTPVVVDVKDEDGNPTGEKKERSEALTFYFGTTKSGGLSEAKTIKLPLKGSSSNGQWEEYECIIDHKDWTDKITTIRFDPFNAVGKIDIDYIRFETDPAYLEKLNAPKVFEIINGDAEGEKIGFISHNANVSIVMDPFENGYDKCYLFMPKDNTKQWIYAIQDVYFTPGATYKISYDIAFATHGTDDKVEAGTKSSSAMANMQFTDSDGSNHTVGSTSKKITAGEGWIHCEGIYKIPEGKDIGTGNRFTIFSNPLEEIGVGFYLDNVVVEEIKP